MSPQCAPCARFEPLSTATSPLAHFSCTNLQGEAGGHPGWQSVACLDQGWHGGTLCHMSFTAVPAACQQGLPAVPQHSSCCVPVSTARNRVLLHGAFLLQQ